MKMQNTEARQKSESMNTRVSSYDYLTLMTMWQTQNPPVREHEKDMEMK